MEDLKLIFMLVIHNIFFISFIIIFVELSRINL